MSKLIFPNIAQLIVVIFVVGILGITGTILTALIYEVVTHPSDITAAGYVLIAFVVYSIWLCRKILHRLDKKTKVDPRSETKQETDERRSFTNRLIAFLPGFWICLVVISLNGIVISGVYVSANWITTLLTSERYEAEMIGVKVTKLDNRSRLHHRQSTGISFRQSRAGKSFTPIVRFQSNEGKYLERELIFISGETLEVGSRLPVYYSSLTDQAVYKSPFAYGMILAVVVIFLFLLMLALALLSYALIGKVPNVILAFWNRVKMLLFFIVMFLGLVGMTYFLGSIVFEWLFGETRNELSGIAIAFCFVLFVGCLLGGIGMIFAFFGKKPATVRRKKKY